MKIETAHRPWALPTARWAVTMKWHDLLFAHYPVRAETLRPLIPTALEIDTFDGWAWIGVVPFRMTGVRPRYLPALKCTSDFSEINLRTYVKTSDRSGVWFFSLDATNRIAVRIARTWYGLPYFDARINFERAEDTIQYHSRRVHRGAAPAEFDASYKPIGLPFKAEPHTLEHWLTERYCLYSSNRRKQVGYGDIHHAQWSLQHAEAEIRINTMTEMLNISIPPTKPVLHFARQLDVLAWNVVLCENTK
ncbi:MAG: DUF2071 domain-containing protein [Pyrinomonadaceae bacterium]